MKKKVLVVASTSDHLRTFHIPYIEKLKETHEVYTMSRDVNEQFADFNIKFQKKIMSFKNFKIIGEIKKILKENDFDIVFLNTSLAAFFVRFAIKFLKKKPKVVNIVHGYLFGEKTNGFKRKAFLAAEKFVRKQTTHIVVMNNEDYDIVKKHKLCTGEVYKIQGMGINGNRFKKKPIKNTGLEEEINFSFIGELSSRKNQTFLIKFVKQLEKFGINANLNLLGEGSQKRKLEKQIKKLGLENKVKLIGFVDDIETFINKSNYYICASKIEGLPFNILEAMFAGSVIFSSDIKGTVDLIEDFENGVLFELGNMDDLVNKFRLVKNNLTLQEKLRKNAKKTAEKYLLTEVFEGNSQLFEKFVNED